jgi:hypothetical protein
VPLAKKPGQSTLKGVLVSYDGERATTVGAGTTFRLRTCNP